MQPQRLTDERFILIHMGLNKSVPTTLKGGPPATRLSGGRSAILRLSRAAYKCLQTGQHRLTCSINFLAPTIQYFVRMLLRVHSVPKWTVPWKSCMIERDTGWLRGKIGGCLHTRAECNNRLPPTSIPSLTTGYSFRIGLGFDTWPLSSISDNSPE